MKYDHGRFAVMVGVLVGVLSLSSSTPRVSEIVAAPMGTPVSSPTVTLSPNDPGRSARLTITFVTNDQLVPGDEIIITFEDDWQVPFDMSPSLINLRASDVTNECGGASPPSVCPGTDPVGGPFSNLTVNPDGVRIDFVGPQNDEGEITLQVPDMSTDVQSGSNSIATGATVTVIFMQSAAGIINPSEGLRNNVKVSTSVDMTLVEALDPDTDRDIATVAGVKLTDVTDDRGSIETLLAIGVEGNESATRNRRKYPFRCLR